MKTEFSIAQLARVEIKEANDILRKCVHCGFCNATCPTFVLSGNELEGPRGRIYLMKSLLEEERPPKPEEVRHIDSCLSCLACETTCPSGVAFSGLVDQTRVTIEKEFDRPLVDQLKRALLGWLLPRPSLFRLSLQAARALRILEPIFPPSIRQWTRHAPPKLRKEKLTGAGSANAAGPKATVVLHLGCAGRVSNPEINEATIQVLNRQGFNVIVASDAPCCGSLALHLGQEDRSTELKLQNTRHLSRLIEEHDADYVVSATTGCTPTLKEVAGKFASKMKDLSEIYDLMNLSPSSESRDRKVAYHAPCSLTHTLKNADAPRRALLALGFEIEDLGEPHLCCGSAGTYSLLQGPTAKSLRQRKQDFTRAADATVVASSNVGCISHLSVDADLPIVHVIELIDWATGGPMPKAIKDHKDKHQG